MVDFKIGDRVACQTDYGYRTVINSPETIVRETKTCWVTDKGSQIRKDNGSKRGFSDSFAVCRYIPWTNEMEINKQRGLLKVQLEREISNALVNHKFTLKQLQYIKSMLEG